LEIEHPETDPTEFSSIEGCLGPSSTALLRQRPRALTSYYDCPQPIHFAQHLRRCSSTKHELADTKNTTNRLVVRVIERFIVA
jgi:hypothetical protein